MQPSSALWTVVYDPTPDLAYLTNRFAEVALSAQYRGWPEGIVFQHRDSGTVAVYTGGRLIRYPGACKAAGNFSIRLTRAAVAFGDGSPQFEAVLRETREHYNNCPNCRAYLEWITQTSKPHPEDSTNQAGAVTPARGG